MEVREITAAEEKQRIARLILESLPDWFGIPEAVKTVQLGKYPEYDATNRFYLALGFGEFEVFPTLWDEWNPCQIYVMSLK